jgi:hypothetical protein
VRLARGHLLYGELLRRERRRNETREQLRTAHDMFSRIGAEGSAGRARHELRATGETARQRATAANQELTAQAGPDRAVAQPWASTPRSVPVVLSPLMVQYHLGNVFAELGISLRSQLDRVDLPDGRVAVEPPGPGSQDPGGPGTAGHWPVALGTGGYEHALAGTTLHVKKPPARARSRGQPPRMPPADRQDLPTGGEQVAGFAKTPPGRDRRSRLRRL